MGFGRPFFWGEKALPKALPLVTSLVSPKLLILMVLLCF